MEEEVEILVDGCIVVPMNGDEPIEDGAIAIKNGRITYVGKSQAASNIKAEKKVDAKGKVALPGLINCHTHASMTLFRGMAEDQPLDVWLREAIWPYEAKLRPEDVYSGALLGCLEMIRSGTTCFADMYFHENMVTKAVEKSGLRAVLAEGIIETGREEHSREILKNSVNFIKEFHKSRNGRITCLFGPHAVYSCSSELLSEISELAAKLGVGIHLHLAESKATSSNLKEEYGWSEVELLEKIGVLKQHVLAAHCVNLTRKDMQTLSQRKVNVAYVPVANMKLGLGAARISELVTLNVNVGLGTDGPASNNSLDMFETMKVAALLQKNAYSDPEVLPAEEAVKMATIHGAEALRLKSQIGSIDIGKKADLILLDISKPHLRPLHNIYATIVYSARGSDVDTTIVDGKIVMENRLMKTFDEQVVITQAEKSAFGLISR